jgi:hypothetical protein
MLHAMGTASSLEGGVTFDRTAVLQAGQGISIICFKKHKHYWLSRTITVSGLIYALAEVPVVHVCRMLDALSHSRVNGSLARSLAIDVSQSLRT